jgi:anti-anti-sigma factor
MGAAGAPRAFHGRVEGTLVLRLCGPIRFVAAQALRRYVDDLIADEDGAVLVDMNDVEVIDSTGMGLLARIGRSWLRGRGRRVAIACPENDIAITLRSASFDELFVMLDEYPFDDRAAAFTEIPLDALPAGSPELGLGHVILDAHRDLASVSQRNVDAYRDVIAALEADLHAAHRPGGRGDGSPPS